jgi:hypothetical protein
MGLPPSTIPPVYVTDSTGQVWQLGAQPGGLLTATAVSISPLQLGTYPTLETIMNLVRVFLNDWQPGATNTPGEGRITTDNPAISPQTLPALNSAIREVYRELRNVGDPTLIKDNVQVGLPANSVNGPGIQTYLAFYGYWDGGQLNVPPQLPGDMIYPVELWEQQTAGAVDASVDNVEVLDSTGEIWEVGAAPLGLITTSPGGGAPGNQQVLPFVRMKQPQFGLPSRNQTFALGEWEWRQDRLNFVGALCPITIRMRYLAALTQFTTSTNFGTTQIPIMDCEEAVAYKTARIIAPALSGVTPSTSRLDQQGEAAMFQLRNAIARRAQTIEYRREEYTGDHRGYDRNLM